MLVVSLADFSANPNRYKNEPFCVIENGEKWTVLPEKALSPLAKLFNFFTRIFSHKDDTIDGVHRPSRQLKAALRESKYMEKHPEKYKAYKNIDELFDELGIEV